MDYYVVRQEWKEGFVWLHKQKASRKLEKKYGIDFCFFMTHESFNQEIY
jgi:hypothetical protein